MHPLLNLAIHAARLAGKQLLRAFDNPQAYRVTAKGENDWVTDVDQQTEQLITQLIHQKYPRHAILGEESGVTGKNDYLWVIDPIDGTVNFIHGLPSFCISIAVTYRGVPEHAVIFDPIRQELFNASRGEGAFLNNRRIRCSNDLHLAQAMLSVVNGSIISTQPTVPQFLDYYCRYFQQASKIRQQGTVALDCAHLAAGRLDGLAAFNMSYWDLAAGVLLIQEAGAVAIDPYSRDNYRNQSSIVAGSYGLVQEMLPLLQSSTPSSD